MAEIPPFLHFDDMTWLNPDALGQIEWRLRYGTPNRADLLRAASVIGAYQQLVNDPVRRRNEKISGLRRAMASAAGAAPAGEVVAE